MGRAPGNISNWIFFSASDEGYSSRFGEYEYRLQGFRLGVWDSGLDLGLVI